MIILTVIFTVAVVVVVVAQVQQPIVDKSVIAEGGTFTVTCDINRFASGDVPSTAPYISQLSLERTVGTSSRSIIAQYVPLAPVGFNNLTTNVPPGRNWLIEASGGVSSGTVQTNNKNTIKITLLVRDAKCADAGIYRCNATYLSQPAGYGDVSRIQNITAKANTEDPLLTLDHHNGVETDVSTNTEGTVVALSCKVRGPYGLTFSWLTGPASGSNFVPHPIANDIQTVTPSPPPPTANPCDQYLYESIFNITVQPDFTMYICVVQDGNTEVTRKNFTIDGNPTTTEPGTGGSGEPTSADINVGAIVGGVIGGLVLIAIIVIVVYFCWYRKRSDDDSGRDKEVESTNATHAPPPVFYAEPKKAKKDERDGVRPDKGFTNEALDNSYDDSKDHRGPPQYINTVDGEDLPRYEKETHRGRSNKGYEDENEKNEGHGRRHRRDRKDKEDRDDRKPPRKDYEDRDRGRHYSTDDGTDNRDPQVGYGDPNMGTSI